MSPLMPPPGRKPEKPAKRATPLTLDELAERVAALPPREATPLVYEPKAYHYGPDPYASPDDLAVLDDPLERAAEAFTTTFARAEALVEADLIALAETNPEIFSGVGAPTPAVPDTVAIPDVLLGPTAFLCGPAGTGKTYLARAMARDLPGTVLAATTGIASVNLGEGTTINALLKYFDTANLRDAHVSGRLQATLRKLFKAGIRRIVLDEVSMLDGEQLTILTNALHELSTGDAGYVLDADFADELREATPDGQPAIALVLTGDFAQLPPVKAPFAFESEAWPRYAAATHTLSHIWRQADRDFIAALQAARRGDADTVADYFGPRLVQTSDDAFDGPTIVATNDAVERFNALRLAKLQTPVARFTAVRWGTQRADWKQIPDTFGLKVGALVMILANRREQTLGDLPGKLVYANGDLGHIEALDETRGLCHVRLHRTDAVVDVEWVERQNTVPLEPGDRKRLKAAGEAHRITTDGRQHIVGTVRYLPLRAAYATTVHRSQGLSLDAVQVNTREGFFKTAGMLYVSLSRARTAEGLRLIGSVDGLRARCTVNAKVAKWL